jgi:anti-sigma factor RsiW
LTRCADSRFIPLLARGELDPAEEARLRTHLADCPTCPGELAEEEQLTRRLREEVPRPAAPAELRAALEKMMRAQHAPPPGRRKARRLLFAAAAAVVLAIAGFLALRGTLPANDPQALARHAAAAHRTIDRERDVLPSETAGASARVRELAQRYGLPVTTAFQGDAEVRLVSARQGLTLGKVSAVLVYLDAKDRLVTLEILPGGDVTIPRERTRTIQQFHPMLTRADQLGVVVWKQGATLYLLTAPFDDEELAQLYLKVRTHTS